MVLLTGGTGFLGEFILKEALAAGIHIRMLVRNSKHPALKPYADAIRQGRIELAEGDLLDAVALKKAMQGVDSVIHSAAVVSFWKRQYPFMRRVNVGGTASVVNLALDAGVRRLVHISSVAALGNRPLPITENSAFRRETEKSYYGYTKALAEREVYRGIEEGLNAVLLNPSIIIGAGHWSHGSPRLFQDVWEGLSLCPKGTNGYVAVETVAQTAFALSQNNDHTGERFILNAENLSYVRFFTQVAQSLGKKPPATQVPEYVAVAYGWFNEQLAYLTGQEPLVTASTARTASRVYEYDNTKSRNVLGITYEPMATTIARTATAFLAERRKP
jgi:nucleoside-diphosphate-sugar epimerase